MENSSLNSKSDDEIDLKQIFYGLVRNKKIIFITTFSGLIIGTLIAFTSRKIWQGGFQIVLENPPSSIGRDVSSNSSIMKFIGLNPNSSRTLSTEVEILKSSSVLMNVFDFVKVKKASAKNKSNLLRFTAWKNNLDIRLEGGTSVLNINYKDTDKDLILPVLDKISSTYQDYSGKKRIKEIDNAINYFEEQIAIYERESNDSQRKAQEYALRNDLSIIGNESGIDVNKPAIINVEAIRVEAANRIKLLDQKLDNIKRLKDNGDEIIDQLIYFSSAIPSLRGVSNQLSNVDSSLQRGLIQYKEQDKFIQSLIKERIFLIELLEKQLTGFLIAEKVGAQSRMKAAERADGVLSEYRRLLNNSDKDKATLRTLDANYRSVLLEKARLESPWELITKPVLLPNPVAPKKKTILAIGLFGGFLLGSTAALLNDNKKYLFLLKDDIESMSKM
tara:strand:+ start:2029 stop:3366 length:1338 start_codon:yes stop_codon:yes gene_type:complete